MGELKRAIRLDEVPWRRNDDPRGWLNYKRLIWKETGSNDLCIGLGRLDPGKVLDLHHHQEDAEFYYVLEGNAKVTIDEELIDATPGTAIYIPVAAKHKIVNDSDEKFVFLYGLNAETRRYVYDVPLKE
ncbi:cupin domain-containing protein [Candidatus Bathyarchaeota archaeon]|nr:cupin domain-containing protein [Candidatus Bathyarchaeota archaeon]